MIFVAWQHGTLRSLATGSYGGLSDLRKLFSEDADNTFLVKGIYWLSF